MIWKTRGRSLLLSAKPPRAILVRAQLHSCLLPSCADRPHCRKACCSPSRHPCVCPRAETIALHITAGQTETQHASMEPLTPDEVCRPPMSPPASHCTSQCCCLMRAAARRNAKRRKPVHAWIQVVDRASLKSADRREPGAACARVHAPQFTCHRSYSVAASNPLRAAHRDDPKRQGHG